MSLSIAVVIVKEVFFFWDWVIGRGGVHTSTSLDPRCTGTCWTFKAIDVQRLLLVHSALEHIQSFNCCSSKIVNTKVGPVIDIDKALLMTKLLHCLVIAWKLYFVVSFHKEDGMGIAIDRLFKSLRGRGWLYLEICSLFRNKFELDR